MVKIRCKIEKFEENDIDLIEEFIDNFYKNYEVKDISHTIYNDNGINYISICIIYEEIVDREKIDKELLIKILDLDYISINKAQVEFMLGFNAASKLIYKLEEMGIISNKNEGRKLLMPKAEAIKKINEL